MGVYGLDRRAGLTTPNLMEAETNRALAGCARRLVVVADHTKWGVVGLSRIAGLSEVDVQVTDSGVDDRAVDVLSERVRELVVAAG